MKRRAVPPAGLEGSRGVRVEEECAFGPEGRWKWWRSLSKPGMSGVENTEHRKSTFSVSCSLEMNHLPQCVYVCKQNRYVSTQV